MPEKNRQAGAESNWRLNDIEKLIDLLVKQDIGEFEMEKDGFRIRIRRGEIQNQAFAPAPAGAVLAMPVPTAMQAVPPDAPPVPAQALPTPTPTATVEASGSPTDSTEGLYIIKSPIVGTFYRGSSPNTEPFVQAGDVVRMGQVLCIIEAMKLMNEIESEVNGEVVRLYVENGQPVEYGQSLFAIKPSHKK